MPAGDTTQFESGTILVLASSVQLFPRRDLRALDLRRRRQIFEPPLNSLDCTSNAVTIVVVSVFHNFVNIVPCVVPDFDQRATLYIIYVYYNTGENVLFLPDEGNYR